MRSLLWYPLLLTCLVTGSAVGPAANAAEVTLRAVLSPAVSALLAHPPSSVHLGLLVRDLDTGKVLEAARPDELFVPASTMKLVSMAARLTQGGPQSRYSVEALAPAQEVSRHAKSLSRLSLRGLGDPSLSVTGLYSLSSLAQQLAKSGIEEVGELSVAPTIDSTTWPALPLGTPLVPLRLQEYPGWNDTPENYAGRVTDAFAGQLRAAGIRVGAAASGLGRLVGQQSAQQFGRVTPGYSATPASTADVPEVSLASVQSAPLIALLRQTLKPSDNVWADQLAARLGQVPGQASTASLTHAGMLAGLRRFLIQVGVKPAPLSLSDASGLSEANRLTPRTLVTVLERMYDLPITALKTPLTPAEAFAQRKNLFIEALPRGGTGISSAAARAEGGTLAGRFVGSGLDVRAKTGTLPGASSLAGYVRGKSGHVLAFAIMVDQAPGNTLDLRAYQDRLLKVIAQSH
ncbi:D-alanyl-D-alanine carboxypeptidase/D-alanyl-D-alanine-endopeptidase [Deinococcus rubellus]|uniref:D-alanyl-D-alanine carboxypeptidase n=1 Tax=Deinococcus rubellus TaxID=1889240 RepID=A0ABY5YJY5_9DEIO|nr:D-alanyl-D-alanine carboxypeptidase [Deinococcus rubellus]UWX64569.1 D-alanyl-D-alanine carboxypeptidase [Deinococcus rubellus]